MLSRRHCPHTGIVNFFAAADPFVAIGSVIKAGEPALYHWRYYLGRAAVGVAADMRSAENHLLMRHRDYLRSPEQAGWPPSEPFLIGRLGVYSGPRPALRRRV